MKGNGKFHTIREGSLQIHGAKLFNALPKSVRNLTRTSVDEFKVALDKFLQTIPDEPKLPGYTPIRRSENDELWKNKYGGILK